MTTIFFSTAMFLFLLGSFSSYASYSKRGVLINQTESDSYTLYLASKFRGEALSLGERVSVTLPPELRDNLSHSTWFSGRELIKTIGALEGDTYCLNEGGVFEVRGKVVGFVQYYDRTGAEMPRLSEGCRTVSEGNFVAVSPAGRSTAFDSRYFGELPLSSVVRRVEPLL